jgi:hypothetical protein
MNGIFVSVRPNHEPETGCCQHVPTTVGKRCSREISPGMVWLNPGRVPACAVGWPRPSQTLTHVSMREITDRHCGASLTQAVVHRTRPCYWEHHGFLPVAIKCASVPCVVHEDVTRSDAERRERR